jgi:hypothetical protein
MREKFVVNNWEYEIHDLMTRGEYGFRVDIFKNNEVVYSQAGFGGITGARIYARDYIINKELGIEINRGEDND